MSGYGYSTFVLGRVLMQPDMNGLRETLVRNSGAMLIPKHPLLNLKAASIVLDGRNDY